MAIPFQRVVRNVTGLKNGVLPSAENSRAANPEIGLFSYLYSFLPNRNAIDVGANIGDVSSHLLNTGYHVHAFEPYPPVFEKLRTRLQGNPSFVVHPYAVGSCDKLMTLHVAADLSGGKYGDPSLYSTLMPHPLYPHLAFSSTFEVPVRSLASLHERGEIPAEVSLIKIDTEGFDLEVIRGMGNHDYCVVVAEFWDEQYMFGRGGTANNKLPDLVEEMRRREYHWFVVMYRVEGSYDVAYYANRTYSVEKSWGNVFFFRKEAIFSRALDWCCAVVPEAVLED